MPTPSLSLQEISDRIEINDLLTRYTVAIDTKDWNLLDTCFTPDAQVDYTTSGGIKGEYPEVRAWLEKALAPFTMTQHLIIKTSVVAWLIMVRIGRMSSPFPLAPRMSTRKTESPSVRFFTCSLGVVRASNNIRSECSARDVQTF